MLDFRSPLVGDRVVVKSISSASAYIELGGARDTIDSGTQGVVLSTTAKVLNEPKFIRVLFAEKIRYVSEKDLGVLA